MPTYYPGLRDITRPKGRVICISDLGNIKYDKKLERYLDIYKAQYYMSFRGQ
jgi:hypothetical protein